MLYLQNRIELTAKKKEEEFTQMIHNDVYNIIHYQKHQMLSLVLWKHVNNTCTINNEYKVTVLTHSIRLGWAGK